MHVKHLTSFIFSFLVFLVPGASAQQDSIFRSGGKVITLSEVVLEKKLDVPFFIERVKNDTGFYKAFRNLRILGFTSLNDIRVLGKRGREEASLKSRTRQIYENNCRRMEVLEEVVTGDFYDEGGSFNYYTAEMYASLFFTKGKVCRENNVVGDIEFSLRNKKGMDKHREQLKMLFFNPGKRISGLPFMSGKTGIFDDDVASRYDMRVDAEIFNGVYCYLLTQKVKKGEEGRVVIDEMKTWFDDVSLDVVARHYSLSYDAGLYDFNVNMQVETAKFRELTVPVLIRYNGNWKVPFKKRERTVFTATLFDFE